MVDHLQQKLKGMPPEKRKNIWPAKYFKRKKPSKNLNKKGKLNLLISELNTLLIKQMALKTLSKSQKQVAKIIPEPEMKLMKMTKN